MAGYKGYTLSYKENGKGMIVSPIGEHIVAFYSTMGSSMPFFREKVPGIEVRNKSYQNMNEALRDIADQHRALTGADRDGPILEPADARTVIISTVQNLQVNHNSPHSVQQNTFTSWQVEQINAKIDNAPSSLLKEVLKEWIPQAFLGAGVAVLLQMLGIAP